MVCGPLSKSDAWLFLPTFGRCLHILVEKTRLFKNEAKVSQSVKRKDLVHVINTGAEFEILRDVFDDLTWFLIARYVVLVALGLLWSELSFQNVGEGIWDLRLASEDSAD